LSVRVVEAEEVEEVEVEEAVGIAEELTAPVAILHIFHVRLNAPMSPYVLLIVNKEEKLKEKMQAY
jgi:hypothetical protein